MNEIYTYLNIYNKKYIMKYIFIYIYIYIYIKQVKQESRLTPSKDDHKMQDAMHIRSFASTKI